MAAQIAALSVQMANGFAAAAAAAAVAAAAAAAVADKQFAKLHNSSAMLGLHALIEVSGPGHVLPSAAAPPIWFPRTRSEFANMTGPRGVLRASVFRSFARLLPYNVSSVVQRLHCMHSMHCLFLLLILSLPAVPQSQLTLGFAARFRESRTTAVSNEGAIRCSQAYRATDCQCGSIKESVRGASELDLHLNHVTAVKSLTEVLDPDFGGIAEVVM